MHGLSPSAGNPPLASLPAEARAAILDKLTPIVLENRNQLYRAEQPIEHVYFVEAGMISIVCTLENGMQAEVGVVGRKGVLGASVLSGVGVSFFDAMVQMPGAALRMSVRDFLEKVETCTPLRNHLLRYNECCTSRLCRRRRATGITSSSSVSRVGSWWRTIKWMGPSSH